MSVDTPIDDTTTPAEATTAAPAGGKRVLAVVTSVREYEKVGYRTGLWLGELTHFYDALTEAGHTVDIVSIAGGEVPLDPESLSAIMLKMGGTGTRYADREFMNLLADTRAVKDLSDAELDAYDAVYLTGGHGTMFDFTDPALAAVITRFWESDRIVSAVCHGPCGLADVTLSDGTHLVAGRTVTGFSWNEERLAGRADAVPYSLEERLKERGATYTKALVPMVPHVEVDGRLVTGQNPTSAARVAAAVITAMSPSAEA